MAPGTRLYLDSEWINLEANNSVDTYDAGGRNMAFVVADGTIGNDVIENFGFDDSLITTKKIFDGNHDGFIGFGRNGLLDIDRTSTRKAGEDHLTLTGGNELRYLGELEGQHAYASAKTLRVLRDNLDPGAVEGTIGSDFIETNGHALLIDNRLGLLTGDDYVYDMTADQFIVTTAPLRDANGDDYVDDFRVKDETSGELDIVSRYGTTLGTLTFLNTAASALHLVATTWIGEATYYYYSIESSQS